jgi:type II secretory pathway pseudopilin PulG
VLVILVILALSVMVTGALVTAQTTQRQSRADQDAQAAYAAAEAGIDDYLYRLGRDDTYWRFRSATDTTSTAPLDPGNPAMAAFSGTDPDAGWAPVPGTSGDARYHYDPSAGSVARDGSIVLQSTGRVRDQTRTIEVTIRKETVLELLYFTEYETVDPVNRTELVWFPGGSKPAPVYNPFQCYTYYWCIYGSDTQRWAADNCQRHYYEGRDQNRCTIISFGSNDVLNGPFHTNDAFYVNGTPTWRERATTSWQDPGEDFWLVTPGGTAAPNFLGGDPAYHSAYELPQSNAEIQVEADRSRGGEGCLYTGPTRITFNGNGTMDVVSPYTPTDDPALNTGCLGTGIALPANGVIYVRGAPPERCNVTQQQGQPERNPLGYPVSGDITSYRCTSADVFVSGTYRGQATIAAENNIVVTGDLRAADRSSGDLLGLVANNFVEIYHPVTTCSSGTSQCRNGHRNLTSNTDRIVDAAILALQHTFRVQHHDKGMPRGTLRVTGTIAQQFRGPVATFGTNGTTGYAKDYNYDTRLAFLSPPHFLEPTDAPWRARAYGEVRARY